MGLTRKVRNFLREEVGVEDIHARLWAVNLLAGCLPRFTSRRTRAALYRLAGFSIGRKTQIYGKMNLWGRRPLRDLLVIGDDCRISTPVAISLYAPVTIGSRVSIAFGVTIVTPNAHHTNDPERRAGWGIARPITIHDGVWIGANVTILPGITIGEGAVVGAGSVVTRDVAPHTMVGGNPAHVIRPLNPDFVEVPLP